MLRVLLRLRAAPLLACALLACGESRPPRWVVVQRDLAWESEEQPAASTPLSTAWNFDVATPSWHAAAGAAPAELADGMLRLAGTGQVDLFSPPGGRFDVEIHQRLSLRLRAEGATSMSVHWRAAGAEFSPGRATSEMALPSGAGWQTLTVSLASLRGIRGEADAAEGVEELRLRFRGAAGAPLRVEIDQIALLSDFDDAEGLGFATGTLTRGGVLRRGLALRAGATVVTELPGGGPRRLRLALAAAGTDAPLAVLLGSRSGRVPERTITLQPDAPWTELALDVPAGEPLRFTLHAAADDPTAVLLVGSVMLLEPSADARPNLVLYVEDTLRADRLSTCGGELPTDPWLSACAAQGAVLTRTWSTSSWTRPAISSVLTGLDAVAHGNVTHARRVPEALVTLAETLADAGWVTASFVTNYHAGAWAGLQQGFDSHAEPSAYGAAALRSTLTSAAIAGPLDDFLRAHADEQVFVFAHSLDPHAPYEPPIELQLRLAAAAADQRPPAGVADAARWERDTLGYAAEILHNDGQLARLDATLGSLGLRDGTLFALVADHGEQFAEHGAWEHRQSLHDEETRVPWVLRLPGRIAPGQRVDEPASLRDVAPTLLGLLGEPPPASWQGRDLSPLIAAPPGAPTAAGARPRAEPLLLDVTYDEPRAAPREVAVVLWPWKLIASVDAAGDPGSLRATALHDLSLDPRERSNMLGRTDLAPQVAALLEIARERLAAGPLAPDAAANAEPMDPALMEWMRAMGYLR